MATDSNRGPYVNPGFWRASVSLQSPATRHKGSWLCLLLPRSVHVSATLAPPTGETCSRWRE
jgi:hypothetical protein